VSNNDQEDLPQGWRLVELRNVVCVVNGTTPQSSTSDYWGGDIVWITPTDLGKLKEREIVTSERKITQTGFDSCGLNLVPSGTVILSSRAPIGHLGIAKTELCINQGCKALIPKADIDSDFLYFAMRKSVSALQALGSGSTFAEVSKSQVEKFEIPLPPLAEQKRIAAILTEQLAAVEKARKSTQEQLTMINALPKAFLHQAFSGAL
jgi:type I restriction enzyme S subunit